MRRCCCSSSAAAPAGPFRCATSGPGWRPSSAPSPCCSPTSRSRRRAKLHGSWDVLGHPGRIRSARRELRAAALPESTRPAHVRSNRGTVTHNVLDDLLAGPRARRAGPGGWRPSPRIWRPLLVAVVLSAVAVVRSPGVLIGAGTAAGRRPAARPGSVDLLSGLPRQLARRRAGHGAPLPSYLPVLGVFAAPLLGSVDLLLRLCFALAVPLAFLSAYISAGSTWLGSWRPVVALAWALLPAGVAAAGGWPDLDPGCAAAGSAGRAAYVRALALARAGVSGLRPVVVASALIGLVAAFAPTAYLMAAVGCVVAWFVAGCPRWAVRAGLVPLLVAAGFVVLWAPRAIASPWLLLTDLGSDRSQPDHAGRAGPRALPRWSGRARMAGHPAAGRALFVPDSGMPGSGHHWSPQRLPASALAAIAWLPALAAALWSGEVAVRVWPGQPVLMVSAVLLLALTAVVIRPGRSSGLSGPAWSSPSLCSSSGGGSPRSRSRRHRRRVSRRWSRSPRPPTSGPVRSS